MFFYSGLITVFYYYEEQIKRDLTINLSFVVVLKGNTYMWVSVFGDIFPLVCLCMPCVYLMFIFSRIQKGEGQGLEMSRSK